MNSASGSPRGIDSVEAFAASVVQSPAAARRTEILSTALRAGTPIAVLGAGGVASRLRRALDDLDAQLVAYIDETTSEPQRSISGVPVLGADAARSELPADTLIITAVYQPHVSIAELGERVAADYQRPTVSFLRVASLAPEHLLPHCLVDRPADFRARLPEYQWLYDRLLDDQSRSVLLRHIEFNLTLDPATAPKRTLPFAPELESFAHDLFVDGGAFDGDTVVRYLKSSGNSEARIVAVEPDAQNLTALQGTLAELPESVRSRIEWVRAALWSEDGSVGFSAQGNPSSGVSEESGESLPALTLDTLVGSDARAFIKLDVEGAEQKALEGGLSTLRSGNSAFGVSLYHRVEDPVQLVRFLLDQGPYEGVFLRAHGENSTDLMAYAFPSS